MIRWNVLVLLAGCVALSHPGLTSAAGPLPPRSAVHLPGASPRTLSFVSLGQPTQTLTGNNPTIDLYIPAPNQARFGHGSVLSIVYSQSTLLDPARSAVSVLLNGVDVGGQLLRGREGAPAVFTLPLAPGILNTSSFNHIQINFTLYDRSTQICGPVNPEANVTVYGTSFVRFDLLHRNVSFEPDLGQLPAPFVSPYDPAKTALTVGLPARPTPGELTGISRVLARFGEDLPLNRPRIVTAGPADLAARARASNLVVIGTPRDNPAMAQIPSSAPVSIRSAAWRDTKGHLLLASEGVIVEARNPWDPRYGALLLSGNGAEGVRRAATVLSSGTLRRLLNGSFALLPTPPRVLAPARISTGKATLAALGYGATTQEGIGDHQAVFTFDLPQLPARAGEFDLLYGHGEAAGSSASSVRVDLNREPLATRSLGGSDPARVLWKIPLPANQLRIGTNTLVVSFFLSGHAACSTGSTHSTWALIDSSSALLLPSLRSSGSPDLSLLPFPLVVDGSPNNTVLVVPSATAAQAGALKLAVLLGTQSHVDSPGLTAVGAASATPGLLRGHTVLLDGLPNANPLVAGVGSRLPLRVTSGLEIVGQTPELRGVLQEHGALGAVEEIPSPWDNNQTAVVVTASDVDLLRAARATLFRGTLHGTVATVDPQGRIQSFDTHVVLPGAAISTSQRPIRSLALAGVMCIFLVVALSVWRRRRMGPGS